MPKLIICRGLPASGKTTWAQRVVTTSMEDLACDGNCDIHGHADFRAVRVNRDDLREMLHNGEFVKGVTEEVVIAARNQIILAALRKGWDVISDDTNLRSRNVRDLLKLAAKTGAEVEFKDFTDVPVEECIRREQRRGKFHTEGEQIIRDQYNRFIRGKKLPLPIPELEETPTFAPLPRGEFKAFICDLDGTVAHNNGHRDYYDYTKVSDDEPKQDVILVIQQLILMGFYAIFVSGRDDSCRADTAQWLLGHVLNPISVGVDPYRHFLDADNDNQQGRHKLFMRKTGDDRDDSVIKYEIARDYIAPYFDVKMVFDDRDRVVKMWRQVGYTVSQVAEGDF